MIQLPQNWQWPDYPRTPLTCTLMHLDVCKYPARNSSIYQSWLDQMRNIKAKIVAIPVRPVPISGQTGATW
jgi:hypothetical protein